MDPVIIYGIIAGAISAILAIYRASSHISRWLQQRTLFYVFKYLIYPTFIRRRRFLGPFTRWRILCTLVHWIATAVCNVVGVRDLPQASSRAGSLATLHLVPLLFGNRLSFTADLLGLSLQTCVVLHKSIGIMAVIQASVHTILFFMRSTLTLQSSRHFWGLLVPKPMSLDDRAELTVHRVALPSSPSGLCWRSAFRCSRCFSSLITSSAFSWPIQSGDTSRACRCCPVSSLSLPSLCSGCST